MKVRSFTGASADDMHHYLRTFLEKFPDTIIFYVGTNNYVNESSRVVLGKILKLKAFIQNSLPQCKLIVSDIINMETKI